MRTGRHLPIALLLAGCGAQNPAASAGPDWLVGRWLPVGSDTPYPLACESDAVIVYEADGQFHSEGGSGSWSAKDGRLTERLATVHDPEPDTGVEGKPLVSKIERHGADGFRKVYADGESEIYRRCPSS